MHLLVRIECKSLIMDARTCNRDVNKVRHTHVRDNIHHLQASPMRIQHGKYYFIDYLKARQCQGLDVTCPKRYDGCFVSWLSARSTMKCRLHIVRAHASRTRNIRTIISRVQIVSGSRGVLRPNEVWASRLQIDSPLCLFDSDRSRDAADSAGSPITKALYSNWTLNW